MAEASLMKQYSELPEALRQRASSKAVMDALAEFEEHLGVNLAELVMRYVVGEVTEEDLEGELLVAGVLLDDLDETAVLFTENVIKPISSPVLDKSYKTDKTDKTNTSDRPVKSDKTDTGEKPSLKALEEQYQKFAESKEVRQVSSQLESQGVAVDHDTAKQELYSAINKQDRERFLVNLAKLFKSGAIESLFREDQRYISFWRERVRQHQGLEEVARFDENPASPRYLGGFVRYVLEQRFATPLKETALWGTYLSALARAAGDATYEHLAHGAAETGKFVWDI